MDLTVSSRQHFESLGDATNRERFDDDIIGDDALELGKAWKNSAMPLCAVAELVEEVSDLHPCWARCGGSGRVFTEINRVQGKHVLWF